MYAESYKNASYFTFSSPFIWFFPEKSVILQRQKENVL